MSGTLEFEESVFSDPSKILIEGSSSKWQNMSGSVLSKQCDVLWQCFMCGVLYLVCPASRSVDRY